MAKVVCTVKYNKKAKKVTRTYHIEFGKSDTFEVNTPNKELALMVEDENPAAKKLVKRWKRQRSSTSLVPADEPSDVYITGHPVKPRADRPAVHMTKFPASFTVPTAGLAKFICGYYEAHPKPGEKEGFVRYPRGAGQTFPEIP
jgi:hypothetical protein